MYKLAQALNNNYGPHCDGTRVHGKGSASPLFYLFFVKALIKSRFILKKIDVQSK